MKFTDAERMMLILCNKSLAAVSKDKHERERCELAVKMLQEGYHEMHATDCLPYLSTAMTKEDMEFVGEVMTMYQRLQWSYEKLSPKEKATIKADALEFPGFDGSNETDRMGYARFFIEDLERFENLKYHKGLNSHWPSSEKYRAMLRVAPDMNVTTMSAAQIKRVLDADGRE